MFYFYTPENVKKTKVFWRFHGVYKWNIGLKRVNKQNGYVFTNFECSRTNIRNV